MVRWEEEEPSGAHSLHFKRGRGKEIHDLKRQSPLAVVYVLVFHNYPPLLINNFCLSFRRKLGAQVVLGAPLLAWPAEATTRLEK